MTLEQFNQYRIDVEYGLLNAIALYHRTGILKSCVSKIVTKKLGIPEDKYSSDRKYKRGEAQFEFSDIKRMEAKGYTVKIKADTYPSGRYDFVDYIYLECKKKVLIKDSKIFKARVKERMHIILKKHIKKEMDLPPYTSIPINCSVMDLFKAGEVTWEQVVKSHNPNCEF